MEDNKIISPKNHIKQGGGADDLNEKNTGWI